MESKELRELPIFRCEFVNTPAQSFEPDVRGGYIVRLYLPELTEGQRDALVNRFRNKAFVDLTMDEKRLVRTLSARQIISNTRFSTTRIRDVMPDVELPEYKGKKLTWKDFSSKQLLFLKHSTEVIDKDTGQPHYSLNELAALCGVTVTMIEKMYANPKIKLVRQIVLEDSLGEIKVLSVANLRKGLRDGLKKELDQVSLGYTKAGLQASGLSQPQSTNVTINVSDSERAAAEQMESEGDRDSVVLKKIMKDYEKALANKSQ